MSDLQCPATLLIAHHGHSDYADAGLPSDGVGALTEQGHGQVRQLVEQVRDRGIAGVYCSPMRPAVQSAELAASSLGVRCIVADGLQSTDEAYPGAEDSHLVVQRFKQAVGEIADTHRGETVLVFTHGAVMSLAVPQLSFNVRSDFAAQKLMPSCVAVEVEVDADGWRIVSWPVSADPATI